MLGLLRAGRPRVRQEQGGRGWEKVTAEGTHRGISVTARSHTFRARLMCLLRISISAYLKGNSAADLEAM